MDNMKFSDNMKDVLKYYIIPVGVWLLFLVRLIILITPYDATNADINRAIIKNAILLGISLLYLIYLLLYLCLYSGTIEGDDLTVKSLFGKRNIKLVEGMMYSYRRITRGGYYLIKIFAGEKKIAVRTKKPRELVDVLLTYDILLKEDKNKM